MTDIDVLLDRLKAAEARAARLEAAETRAEQLDAALRSLYDEADREMGDTDDDSPLVDAMAAAAGLIFPKPPGDLNVTDVPKLTREQAVIIGAYTGTLCGDFSSLHKAVEERLGRQVWTHEFASPAATAEIKAAFRDEFLALVPEEKDDA